MGQIFDRPGVTPPQFIEALPAGLWTPKQLNDAAAAMSAVQEEDKGEGAKPESGLGAEVDEKYPELTALALKLKEVREYGKSSESHAAAIRDAMSNPNDESKLTDALKDLSPSVDVIAGWYDAGEALAGLVPRLAADVEKEMAKDARGASGVGTRAMCIVLTFMLEFDAAKMSTPSVQNDFSFVRRAQNKNAALTANILDPNKASVCSMFIAQSSPMIARVATELDSTTALKIAKVASCCANACSDKRLDPGQRDVALSAMTAAFVLYDRAAKTPGGAFGSQSPVNAKRVATAIRKFAEQGDRLNVFFGAFMYSTVNYSKAASTAVQNIVDR
mmetsp:Transcript_4363/g.13625  ORF Transcript_4363/g.13625 Transcript_4363/m.13625 type:complete len:332 (-) Transcript_4363:666-1661(-)